MKKKLSILTLMIFGAGWVDAGWFSPDVAVVGLRCEYLENPLGIDTLTPRLSWRIDAAKDARSVRQIAYQVLVASSEELLKKNKGDLWDSGKVASDQSIQVEYGGPSATLTSSGQASSGQAGSGQGKALETRMRCFWKVRVWTTADDAWSKPARWTMGLLKPDNWQASWISTEVAPPLAVADGTLVISNAIYAALDGTVSVDVTKHVTQAVKDNRLSLQVHPDLLGGDPALHHVKELRVDYTFNGEPRKVAVRDFDELQLPEPLPVLLDPLDEPHVRRTFMLEELPESALAFVNVMGFYELYVNGEKVGEDIMSPALSNYHTRSFYLTYDLKPYLRKGRNSIGLWLSRGWYWKVLDGQRNPAVNHDTAIARLQLDMIVKGKPVSIGTDKEWRCKSSGRKIIGSWSWNKMGGEQVDARREDPQWADPELDESDWLPVTVVPSPSILAEAQKCPPMRILKTIQAASSTNLVQVAATGDKRCEVDFGTNLTGWLRLRMRGLKVGDQVVIRYYDKKNPMQDFNQIDRFISSGRAEEEFCSKFNYHGFRWAIIEGLPAAPRIEDAQALAISADWETSGEFACSSPLFSRMHEVNLWTLQMLSQCGFLSDCPHRERAGYGDGQVSIESCIMNFGMQPFYEKWAQDWFDGVNPDGYLPHTAPHYKFGGGGPGWGGAGQALTWRTHLYYGDLRIVKRHYDGCLAHIKAIELHAKDDIVRAYGGAWGFIGDWVPPERGMDTHNWPPQPAAEFFNNCYRLYLREQLALMADLLGRVEEARAGRAELARLRPLIHEAFYDQEHQIYVLDEQSYQLMPLMTGVVPETLRPVILKKLEDGIRVNRKGHLDTGMLGTYFLIQYLQEMGRNDLLFEIVNQTTHPGWGYMLEQGATTWWEQWNGYYSQIHSCFTSLDGWFYQGLAGIRADPSTPAFKKIIIKPAVVGDITWVTCHHDSAYGRIVSNWKLEGKKLTMNVTIPPNTTATVYVPILSSACPALVEGAAGPAKGAASVTESGHSMGLTAGNAVKAKGAKFLRMEDSAAVYEVGSGHYEFIVTNHSGMRLR